MLAILYRGEMNTTTPKRLAARTAVIPEDSEKSYFDGPMVKKVSNSPTSGFCRVVPDIFFNARIVWPERIAATRHNVKAWGIAPGNGNIEHARPEGL